LGAVLLPSSKRNVIAHAAHAHHALRVGLCVFQKTFEDLAVDRFLELELELILSQMAQKPMLRGEVGARALRVRSLNCSKARPKMAFLN